MKKKGIPVSTALMTGITLMVAVPVVILYLIQNSIVTKEAFSQMESHLSVQMASEYATINATYERVLEKTKSNLLFAGYVLQQKGSLRLNEKEIMPFKATNQVTGDSSDLILHEMEAGGQRIAFDYSVVDEIQDHIGGTATIFQMIPEGMLRISTNVLKFDGNRAVGTYIPTDSPVYKTVAAGDTFFGRAYVVNGWYITAYEPIVDDSERIIGCLYVGVPEYEYQKVLLDHLSEIQVGETGHAFVLNDMGDYVVSFNREMDSENVLSFQDEDGNYVFRDLIDDAKTLDGGKTSLRSFSLRKEGIASRVETVVSYSYFEPWGWILGISEQRGDVLKGVRDTSRAFLGIAVGFLILGIIVAMILARAVSRPLKAINVGVESMSKGNLTIRVVYRSVIREFIVVRDTIENVLLKNLRHALREIQKTSVSRQELTQELHRDTMTAAAGSEQINGVAARIRDELSRLASRIKDMEEAIEEINGGITDLDERLENQTVAVTESSSSIEEMTSSIQNVANIAKRESTTSRDLLDQVQEGETALSATGDSVNNIAVQFDSVQDTLSVINSIAASTNLLAMNAAIEAAHAGEAGRGFAVVAEEIRNLANSTTENAEKISLMIKSMIERIQQAISSSEQSSDIFRAINERTHRFVEAFGEISGATLEVSSGAEETLKGVLDLRDSSQQIKDTSGVIQHNTDQIRTSVVEISKTIDSSVLEYGEMEKGFGEIGKSQKEIEMLTEKNSELSENINKQIEFFKISCDENENPDKCKDT